MQKDLINKLLFSVLVILVMGLLMLFSYKFYVSGCKIIEFLDNSQTILMGRSGLESINVENYLNTLYMIMCAITLSIMIVFSPVSIFSKSNKKGLFKDKSKVTPLKSNFLIKNQIAIKHKKNQDKIHQEQLNDKSIKKSTQLSDSQTLKSEAGKPKSEEAEALNPVEDNSENMFSAKHAISNVIIDNTGSGEAIAEPENESPYKDVDAEMHDLTENDNVEVYTGLKEELAVEYLESLPEYLTDEDDESPYDLIGFEEFYSKLGADSKGLPNEKLQDVDKDGKESLLRQAIRDEMCGLIDETSVKMLDNYEKLNQIMREISALRDEIKNIRSKPQGGDENKIDKVLNPKLAMLKEMEAEGQLVLEQIDDQMKRETKEKYSKYSIV